MNHSTNTTLSLDKNKLALRAAKVGMKKLATPFVRGNGEVVNHYAELYPHERKLYRKAQLRNDAQRELGVFQKILTAEADLASVREELKQATDAQQHRAMTYFIGEVDRLERRLANLRGIKPPKPLRPRRGRKTSRTLTRMEHGYRVSVEGVPVGFRTWDQIAQDKLEDMRQDANQELRERADTIATLQGYREGTVGHVHASAEAHTAIVMIERLQAFEATQSQYADEVSQSERIAHFGQESDDY